MDQIEEVGREQVKKGCVAGFFYSKSNVKFWSLGTMLGGFQRPVWQMQELEPRSWSAYFFSNYPHWYMCMSFSPEGSDLKFYVPNSAQECLKRSEWSIVE